MKPLIILDLHVRRDSVKEDNAICADCGHENPVWISSQFGVMVCADCAAAHKEVLSAEKMDPSTVKE